MSEPVMLIPPRDCYACFDFERFGERRCVVCERPVGKRLPEELRPPGEALWWLPTLDGGTDV